MKKKLERVNPRNNWSWGIRTSNLCDVTMPGFNPFTPSLPFHDITSSVLNIFSNFVAPSKQRCAARCGGDLRRSLILIHFSNYHSTSFETFYCYYFRKLHNFHCLSFYPSLLSLSLSITPWCYFGRKYKSF